jgi:hypothetical protein
MTCSSGGILMNDENANLNANADPLNPSTVNINSARPPFEPARARTRHQDLIGGSVIALYIDNLDDPIFTRVDSTLMLGRSGAGHQPSHPLFDLTGWRAFEHGVSRAHALLRWEGKNLVLVDLNSSNGTYLNEVRSEPYTSQQLAVGDMIRLGQMNIEVYFKPDQLPSENSSLVGTVFYQNNQPTAPAEDDVPTLPRPAGHDQHLIEVRQATKATLSIEMAASSDPAATLPAAEGLISLNVEAPEASNRASFSGYAKLRLEALDNQPARLILEIPLSNSGAYSSLEALFKQGIIGIIEFDLMIKQLPIPADDIQKP